MVSHGQTISLSSLVDLLVNCQPIEVWTKCGRRGRIKEPVGTHGMAIYQYICFRINLSRGKR